MDTIKQFNQRDLRVSTDRIALDLVYIHDYLSHHSYWASGIPMETVKKSIEGSLCFGIYDQQKQIGFARVITDYATFGYLADVFIDDSWRGLGLGKWLMEVIFDHGDLQGFRRWMLGTKDAHGLYTKYGFGPLEDPHRLMVKLNRDAYPVSPS